MATIDDFVAGLQLSDEEKKAARQQAAFAMAAGLLSNAYKPTLQGLGAGIQSGLLGYTGAIDDARNQKTQGLHARGMAYDIANKENTYNDAELLRRQQQSFARQFGGGTLSDGFDPSKPQGQTPVLPLPHQSQAVSGNGGQGNAPLAGNQPLLASPPGTSVEVAPLANRPLGGPPVSMLAGAPNTLPDRSAGPPGGVPTKREVAQRYQSYGDYWMSLGRAEKAQQYYELAQKTIPQIKEQRTLTQNGKRVVVNVYTDGSHEILPDVGPDMEKAHFLDTGSTVGAVDSFTGLPIKGGGMYNKTETPDALLSSKTSMRNTDVADRRARELNEITRNGQGKPPAGYRWGSDGQSLQAIPGGPNDTSAKDAQRQGATIERADIVIGKVSDALKQTGFGTTGAIGAMRGMVPGTSAYDLRANVDTIKANIGFDTLQQMRDASPTGGALGQVSERELALLQSTVASLDPNQSTPQLRRSLAKVQTHYENWKRTVQQAQGGEQQQPAGPSRAITVDTLEAEMRRRGIAP